MYSTVITKGCRTKLNIVAVVFALRQGRTVLTLGCRSVGAIAHRGCGSGEARITGKSLF
jgi:hypothetical protein